jgi:hypothetical protein
MEISQVFLSYAREDADAAARLNSRLRKDGFHVWMDQHDLLPGEEWQRAISSAIRQSKVFVALLSENAITKTGYIQKEIREALELAELKPDRAVFVIPARLEQCAVPESLRKWQWLDLFKRGGYLKLKAALVRQLGKPRPTRVSPLTELTAFADPLEHLLYLVFLQQGTFLFSRLPKRGVALSQAHFFVIRPHLNPVFTTLQAAVPDYRELPRSTVEKLLPRDAPWRRPEYLVRKIGSPAGEHFITLASDSAATTIFDYYWQVAALAARHPEIYVKNETDPVYLEREGQVVMVIMPIRVSDETREAIMKWRAI